MGIKEYEKKPLGKLDNEVLRYVGMNPGTWRLYSHFKRHTDRDVDRSLSTLQQFGYLKVVGTSEGRSTWHLTDLGTKAYLSMVVNINSIEWDKQDDGSYVVKTSHSNTPVGYTLKSKNPGTPWVYATPKQYAKKQWSMNGFDTRNEATEKLIHEAYSGV